MKRIEKIVPLSVRVIALLTAAGITVLTIGIHAADLTMLGAPATASSESRAAVSATHQAPDPRSHLRAG